MTLKFLLGDKKVQSHINTTYDESKESFSLLGVGCAAAGRVYSPHAEDTRLSRGKQCTESLHFVGWMLKIYFCNTHYVQDPVNLGAQITSKKNVDSTENFITNMTLFSPLLI